MIYSYTKFANNDVTRELMLPELNGSTVGAELATIDGVTYVYMPDGVDLPLHQPVEIAGSIQQVELSAVIRDRIKAESPHCWLINQRVIEMIRSHYSIEDEMYFARIGVGAATGLYQPTEAEMNEMTVFGEFVEAARQWGREQRALIGL